MSKGRTFKVNGFSPVTAVLEQRLNRGPLPKGEVCGLVAGKAEFVTQTNIGSSAARIRDLEWIITRA